MAWVDDPSRALVIVLAEDEGHGFRHPNAEIYTPQCCPLRRAPVVWLGFYAPNLVEREERNGRWHAWLVETFGAGSLAFVAPNGEVPPLPIGGNR
jgi:hypothetical protein